MIIASGAVRVLVATQPVDFRKGMDGLASVVGEILGFSLLLMLTFVI